MRKFTYAVYWRDMDAGFAAFDAHNQKEALEKAMEIVKRHRFEGTFHVFRCHDKELRYHGVEFTYGTFRKEDYEDFHKWDIFSLRRKEK